MRNAVQGLLGHRRGSEERSVPCCFETRWAVFLLLLRRSQHWPTR